MKKTIAWIFLLNFVALNLNMAHADIFESPKLHQERVMASAISSQDLNTILETITAVSDRLGVRDGFFYDFNSHEAVNYAAATIYTFEPIGIALDFGVLNLDGFAVTVDYNLGRLIPPGDPLTNILQYGYVGAGGGARDRDGQWEPAYGLTVQFKFTV